MSRRAPTAFVFFRKFTPHIRDGSLGENERGETALCSYGTQIRACDSAPRSTAETTHETPIVGDDEAHEKLGPFGSVGSDGSAAEAHPR